MSKSIVHDAEQIEAVIKRNSASVYKIAYLRMGNVHDAEDIMQDVFVRFIKYSPKFESAEHEKAWFIKTTVNRTNSLFSSPWRKHTVPLDEDVPVSDEYEGDDLLKKVMSLPKNVSTAIHLYYYENYSVKEISEITGKSESAVKQLLMRGRNALKIQLTEEGY